MTTPEPGMTARVYRFLDDPEPITHDDLIDFEINANGHLLVRQHMAGDTETRHVYAAGNWGRITVDNIVVPESRPGRDKPGRRRSTDNPSHQPYGQPMPGTDPYAR